MIVERQMRWWRIVVAAGAVAALTLALIAFVVEPRSLIVRHYEIVPPAWPAALDGLKVAVLADLHVGSPGNGKKKMRRVVRDTNAARPDLVLLAGDFVIQGVVGGSFVPPEELAPILAELEAPLGVYAVLGNHDWWLSQARVKDAFDTVGIPVLDDRARRLDVDGTAVWLIGISDYWEGRHRFDLALKQVQDADAPVVAFTHNPDVFPFLPPRIALTFAGHTHGGQVALPVLGRPIVPSAFGDRYAIGHVVEDGRHLFVTPGVGTSIIPVRFRVPPEVSVVTLRAAPMQ